MKKNMPSLSIWHTTIINGGIECAYIKKAPQKGGKYEVDALDHVSAKVEALFQNFDKMSVSTITISL